MAKKIVDAEGIKKMLLNAGVNNLKEFGYPDASPENILTVPVFAGMFDSMLEQNEGKRADIDEVIVYLRGQCAETLKQLT